MMRDMQGHQTWAWGSEKAFWRKQHLTGDLRMNTRCWCKGKKVYVAEDSICKGPAHRERPRGTETLTEHAHLGWKMGAGLPRRGQPGRKCSVAYFPISSPHILPNMDQNAERAASPGLSKLSLPSLHHSSWLMA